MGFRASVRMWRFVAKITYLADANYYRDGIYTFGNPDLRIWNLHIALIAKKSRKLGGMYFILRGILAGGVVFAQHIDVVNYMFIIRKAELAHPFISRNGDIFENRTNLHHY